jgi:pilus retraction protein PilT
VSPKLFGHRLFGQKKPGLLPSLFEAIIHADGDALVLRTGEQPFVAGRSGQMKVAIPELTPDSVNDVVHLLPQQYQSALDELGAVRYDFPRDNRFPKDEFTVSVTRDDEEGWAEIRRRRIVVDHADFIPEELFETAEPVPAREFGTSVEEVMAAQRAEPAPLADDALALPNETAFWPGGHPHAAAGRDAGVSDDLTVDDAFEPPQVDRAAAVTPPISERTPRGSEMDADALAKAARAAVSSTVPGAVGAAVRLAVNDAVPGALAEAVRTAFADLAPAAVADAAPGAVAEAARAAVAEVVVGAVGEAVQTAVTGAVPGAVADAVRSAVADVSIEAVVGEAARAKVAEAVPEVVGKLVQAAVIEAARAAVSDAAPEAVADAARQAVTGRAQSAVDEAARTAVAELAAGAVGEAAQTAVTDAVPGAVAEASRAAVAQAVPGAVEEAARAAVADFVVGTVSEAVQTAVTNAVPGAVADAARSAVADVSIEAVVSEAAQARVAAAVTEAVERVSQAAIGEALQTAVSAAVPGAVAEASRAAVAQAPELMADAVRSAVADPAQAAVGEAARTAVAAAVQEAVNQAARAAVGTAAPEAVADAVRAAVADSVPRAVADAVRETVSGAVPPAVTDAARAAVTEAVPEAVNRAAQAAVSEAVPGAVAEAARQAVTTRAQVAVNEAARAAVAQAAPEAVANAARAAVSEAAGKAVSEAVPAAVTETVRANVALAVPSAVEAAARTTVAAAVPNAVADAVRAAVAQTVPKAVAEAIRETVGDSVPATVTDAARAAVAKAVPAAVESAARMAVADAIKAIRFDAPPSLAPPPTPGQSPQPVRREAVLPRPYDPLPRPYDSVPPTSPTAQRNGPPEGGHSVRPYDSAPPAPAADTQSGLVRLLRFVAARGASTLYLSANARPSVRIDGQVQVISSEPVYAASDVLSLVMSLMPEGRLDLRQTGTATEWVCDVEEIGRVRCTSFEDQGNPGGVFRISTRTATADELGLTKEIQALALQPDGLMLVAGPRSSGKRTIMSALVDHINRNRSAHIIAIGREINGSYAPGHAVISQREVSGNDDDMLAAARTALREDPDVLWLEQIRTGALMSVALEAAASGRLVIGGFSARSATDAIDRIIDFYAPDYSPRQAQLALAENLRCVVAQVLLAKPGGGRVPAREVLLNTGMVTKMIAEGKTSQLPLAIEAGRRQGMVPLTDAMIAYLQKGTIDVREALRHVTDQPAFVSLLKRHGIDTSAIATPQTS